MKINILEKIKSTAVFLGKAIVVLVAFSFCAFIASRIFIIFITLIVVFGRMILDISNPIIRYPLLVLYSMFIIFILVMIVYGTVEEWREYRAKQDEAKQLEEMRNWKPASK